MAVEKTLIFLKPSAVRRGLVGEILTKFERRGFTILYLKMTVMTREEAETFYGEHRGKGFFQSLVDVVSGKRIVAAILEGENAIKVVRSMVGKTNPAEAQPGTIRGDYGLEITDNLIHASDSQESFERESKILFPEK